MCNGSVWDGNQSASCIDTNGCWDIKALDHLGIWRIDAITFGTTLCVVRVRGLYRLQIGRLKRNFVERIGKWKCSTNDWLRKNCILEIHCSLRVESETLFTHPSQKRHEIEAQLIFIVIRAWVTEHLWMSCGACMDELHRTLWLDYGTFKIREHAWLETSLIGTGRMSWMYAQDWRNAEWD